MGVAMVVKTEVCSYSGFRIYPGHGIKYVRGDSKSFLFINRKSKSYFHQKFNPRKIAWTLLYRRMHKKGTLEDTQKKIKQKRNQKPEVRAAAREAALREIKERAKAKQAEKKKVVAKPVQAEKKAAMPKGGKQSKGKPQKGGKR